MSKKKDSIPLHPKYGVNPAVAVCLVCGDSHSVLLYGNNLKEEAPREVPMGICTKCEKGIAEGVVWCVEVAEDEPGLMNGATRTGRIFGVKREAFDRIFTGNPAPNGFCYIPKKIVVSCGMDAAWNPDKLEKEGA